MVPGRPAAAKVQGPLSRTTPPVREIRHAPPRQSDPFFPLLARHLFHRVVFPATERAHGRESSTAGTPFSAAVAVSPPATATHGQRRAHAGHAAAAARPGMARARPARRESRMYAGTEYAWRGERGETCARARAVIRGGRDGAAGDDATRWGGGGAGATNARVAIGGGGHRTGRVCAGVGAGNGGWGTPIDDRDTATRACVQEWPPTHAMLHLCGTVTVPLIDMEKAFTWL
jgi:hypothetical protein